MSKRKGKYSESRYSSSTSASGSSLEEDSEDDGDIINCICNSTADDGFTIQCEQCDIWQHAKCYHIKKRNIPEHFICQRCDRKKPTPSPPTKGITRDRKGVVRKNQYLIPTKTDRNNRLIKQQNKKRSLYSSSEEEEEEEPPTTSHKQQKFVRINKSIAKEKVVQDLFMEIHRQWMESYRPKHGIAKRKTGSKGLDSIMVMESNLLLPVIPKASLKPLRKSLRGNFFQNKNDPTIEKGLFADIHIPENRYLMQVIGQVIRKSEYKSNTSHQFTSLGTPLPHVFFYPSVDICIDARTTGNDTSFIRRSCCPNSELRSIILPNDNEDQTIHLGIYTKEPVDKGEEITIGWNWHRGHIMWKKSKEFASEDTADIMEDAAKKTLKTTLDLIHAEFGKCACEDEESCLFEYLKGELERKAEEQKKKVKSAKGATRAASVESEGDPESSKPKKKKVKTSNPVKLVQKTSSIAPSSPAVSVEESVDIDITSMSPVPEDLPSGSKRSRVSTGIQLPCKKKWLNDFMIQQQRELQQQIQVSTVHDLPTEKPTSVIKEIESVYDEAEMSDGASSQSTLPLDTTPDTTDPTPESENKTKEDNQHLTTTVDTLPVKEIDPINIISLKKEDPLLSEPVEMKVETEIQRLVETISQVNNDTDTINKEVTSEIPDIQKQTDVTPLVESTPNNEANNTIEAPAPKVKKLSIQEYLKQQRGNLPTPDEKPLQ